MNPLVAKPMVIITGPTGAGKSDFAEQLARLVGGVIVNGDVGQLYAPLAIGTAKPDISRATVPHLLFDYLDVPKNLTSIAYRKAVHHSIETCTEVPIVVGGSGFYILGLFFPPRENAPLSEVAENLADVPAHDLWQELHQIDPSRAAKIPPNDAYRLRRALTIWRTTGMLPSQQVPQFSPLAPAIIIHITRPRDELYARINARTRIMFEQGWVDEVRSLGADWQDFLIHKGLIGYPEIISFLRDGGDQEQLIATIQQITRRYAKRQETFWRMMRRRILSAIEEQREGPPIAHIREIVLTSSDDPVYLQQLAHDVAIMINQWKSYVLVGNVRSQ